MDNLRVLTIGGSRNIGYFASKRLLALGATVTFLLRNPTVFDSNEEIQEYVRSGKARLVQGDALVKADVARAWTAAQGDNDSPVDFLLFTVGGTPHFQLTKGFVISPPNLVTCSLLNCLETLPTPHPNIIVISSAGLTHAGHDKLPWLLKPLYGYLLAVPHADKCGVEAVLAHCAGWSWDEVDNPGTEVLDRDWKASGDLPEPGTVQNVVVVRPALLTDGTCHADHPEQRLRAGLLSSPRLEPYMVEEGDLEGRWTVSRRDVAHFVVEGIIKQWDHWAGKRVSIAY